MDILVTGGNGFIGSNLINRLIEEGHYVISIDNLSTGKKENTVSHASYLYADINDISTIDFKADLVYHLAALSRIQPSFNKPDQTFKTNVLGTEKVMEWARLNNAKVVYAGSSSKHFNPYQSPYAMYKYLGEEVVKMYKEVYGVNAEIARFYNVYGPNEIIGDQDNDGAAVIGIWRNQIANNKPLTIVGDGNQKRDFTHVDDIVDGLWRIGMKNEKHKDAWELGSGKNYSINEVYGMFRKKFKTKYKHIPDQAGNYPSTLQINDDAQRKLGYDPQDRLEKYIKSL